jgi:molybdopterin-guanine dinucleotide biosynthesis protein A
MSAATAASDGRIASVSAAVLAGGETAASPWRLAGLPPAAHLVRLFGELFEDVLVVGGDGRGAAVRHLSEAEGPAGTLRGLVAAIEGARAPHVLAVGAEIPLVPSELLLALVGSPCAPVVAPSVAAAPFCAILECAAVLPLARSRLESGRLAVAELFEEVGVAVLPPDALAQLDPHGLVRLRVDTPEGRSRAEAWHAGAAESAHVRSS